MSDDTETTPRDTLPHPAPLGREFTIALQLAPTRRPPIGVGFANKPNDGRYFNKRAETAFECVQWVGRGGALSESANLLTALRHTQWMIAMR